MLSQNGSNFKTQAGKDSYDDYIELYNFFVENGRPEAANQLTDSWNTNIPISGGSAQVIKNYMVLAGNISEKLAITNNAKIAGAANGLRGIGTALTSDQGNGGKALDVASSSAGLATAAGIGGAVMPVIGAGLAIGKGIYDYKKNKDAISEQNMNAERIANMRSFANAKYMNELDTDSARREMAMRGQMSQSPQYQAAMSKAGDTFKLNNSIQQDQLQKQGLGDKSGLYAMMASQNFGNLTNNIGNAVKNSVPTNRAYTGLQGMATTMSPEQMRYNTAGNQYQDSKDYFDYTAPAVGYLNTQGEGLRGYSDEYNANKQLMENKGY